MRIRHTQFFIIALFGIFFSCQSDQNQDNNQKIVINNQLQNILKDNHVNGVILLYEPAENIIYTNDSLLINQGHLPASTFKIANSIVSLETGYASPDRVFEWDGQPKDISAWEKDMTFAEAFQLSCVPCYQMLAREIGVERMKTELKNIGYPAMQFDELSIDQFWLTGQSKITPKQQVDFLQRFHENQLPITESTYDQVHDMMLIIDDETGKLYGKTGLSIVQPMPNGWFVGFAIKENRTIYFATNITQTNQVSNDKFQRIRVPITLLALEEIGLKFLHKKNK